MHHIYFCNRPFICMLHHLIAYNCLKYTTVCKIHVLFKNANKITNKNNLKAYAITNKPIKLLTLTLRNEMFCANYTTRRKFKCTSITLQYVY